MSKYQEAVEQVQLAQTYFEDGAPYSAARCLEKAGLLMRQHADETNPMGPAPKVAGNPDLQIAIGEDAFKAGYRHCAEHGNAGDDGEAAWSAYTPPEDLCGR